MGKTPNDLVVLQEPRAKGVQLVVKHNAEELPHPDKVVIQELNFFYGKTQALKNVSLTVPNNQVTGLIGPSGCGKSTLLRVLNRLYSMYPTERVTGTVLLDGADILGPLVDLQWLRNRVGMVFQDVTVFPMSIYRNIAFAIRLHEDLSRVELGARVEEALTRVALWGEVKDRLDSPAAALSGGQQQRLCIARALSTRPEIVLLDEPTSALDPMSTMKIENLFEDLKLTTTIVLVTHNLQQAARCADQVVLFSLGEVIEAGTALQMFTNPRQVMTQNYITGRFG